MVLLALFNPRSLCPPPSSWRSRSADARRCAHFPTDNCYVIHGDSILLEKCAYRRASACRKRHEEGGGHSERGLKNIVPPIIAGI